MGYDISIGNASLEYSKGDEYMRISVELTTHPDAPTHCPYTKDGNMRSPGYCAWHEFCEDAGITEMFYGQGWDGSQRRYVECTDSFHREAPLLSEHPGAFPLLAEDLQYIRAARIKREATNGGKPPGFWDDDGNKDNGNDHVLARLLWLEFWIDWALTNCEMPAIANR